MEGCAADRYLAASPADFKDEFESLPGDMNPLDPGETSIEKDAIEDNGKWVE